MSQVQKHIQIIDFDRPHYTGLVFAVKQETDKYFLVEDIISVVDGTKLSADGYRKDFCIEIEGDSSYFAILIEQTHVILEFQRKN